MLLLNQVDILSRLGFKVLTRVVQFASDRNTLVSSAKSIQWSKFDTTDIIHVIKNNNGPNMDPWGTPYFTDNISEFIFS